MIRGFGFLLVWCWNLGFFFFFFWGGGWLAEGNALPDTFGPLDNLTKLNLDQNPLVIPLVEVVKEGVEAIKVFMAKRWLDILLDEERKSMLEMQELTQTGWLTRSTSWFKNYVTNVSEYLGSPKDLFLDQQLWCSDNSWLILSVTLFFAQMPKLRKIKPVALVCCNFCTCFFSTASISSLRVMNILLNFVLFFQFNCWEIWVL